MSLNLSVVMVCRNDSHGTNPMARLQHAVDVLAEHSTKMDAGPTELVVVEWNPPPDRPSIKEVIRWPSRSQNLMCRVVSVPGEIHHAFPNSDKIPLFQMIGKNVGIRRARGRFILASNIDILLDDNTFWYATNRVRGGFFTRCDRYDVPSQLPGGSVAEILAWCENSIIDVYTRFGICHSAQKRFEVVGCFDTLEKKWTTYEASDAFQELYTEPLAKTFLSMNMKKLSSDDWRSIRYEILEGHRYLNTLACGDFTLMRAEDWHLTRGYHETPIYSMHLDTLFLIKCVSLGLQQEALPPWYKIFHINHTDAPGPLALDEEFFGKLQRRGVPFLTWEDYLRLERMVLQDPYIGSSKDWGLANYKLPLVEIY